MSRTISSVWRNRLAYSSINFGFSLLAMTVTTLLMYYYTDVLILPAITVSGILFSVRLFDGIIDPFIGHYMDKRTTKFGKYRGYIIYWTVPMCAAFVLMFLTVPFTGAGRTLWCLLLYAVFTLSFSFVEISSLPILASLGCQETRSANNTWKIFGCILATLIAALFALKLVQVLGKGSEQAGYFRMALLFAALVLTVLLTGGFKLREGRYAMPAAGVPHEGFGALRAALTALKEKNVLFLLCMYLCLDAAMALKIQGGIYYLKYNINRQDLITLFLTTSIAASLLIQPAVFCLSKRIHACTLMVCGCIISALAMLIIGLSGSSAALFIAANCIFGMASAFPANLAFSRMADLSEQLAKKHGKPFGGVVNSFLGLASRIGTSSASGLLSIILAAAAYKPNMVQNDYALRGISIGFVTLPILSLTLGGLFAILTFHPFEEKALSRNTQRILPGKIKMKTENCL
ncbi:MFS transporter [Treponema sp. OttesenSCG-928-L16]|nr:MFS transporter [Treponema sp. OttesenSCG-928-L16]